MLVKSDGNTTYLCNDLAYHLDKVERGWEHLIDIWGADHHGQVKSLQVGMQALGVGTADDAGARGHPRPVRDARARRRDRSGSRSAPARSSRSPTSSTRSIPTSRGSTFLLQSIDTTQTFDLDIVTSQSMENPVYYVQYAHARVVVDRAQGGRARRSRARPLDDDGPVAARARARARPAARRSPSTPRCWHRAAVLRAPHRVATWVRDFAARFHGFYRDCRVITDDAALTQARLWLTEACRIGLADALGILGVSAPEVMERLDEDDERRGRGE